MRVLIDTNVLISAALRADSIPWLAYQKAASYPNHGLICEQNVDELKRVPTRKSGQISVDSIIDPGISVSSR